MQHFSHRVITLLLLIILGVVSGCGYKPSAKYARDILGNSISTSISISATDPENSVLIKDSVDSAIIETFHASLVNKHQSQTHLHLSVSNPTYTPLQYDNNGYIISYRAELKLTIVRESKDIKKKYVTTGTYDFSVTPNAVLTDQERFDAIKYSALKAIAGFVAKVSAEGSQL